MAGDSFNWDVIIRLATQGAKNSADDIKAVSSAADELNRTVGLTPKTLSSVEKAMDRMGKTAQVSAKSTAASMQSQLDVENKLANAQAKRMHAETQLRRNRDSAASKSWDSEVKALGGLATAADTASENLPRLRYAMYDVSNALGVAGIAMTGLSVATAATAISMDRAFADVLRTSEIFDTTSSAAQSLRAEFENLFSELPVSWKDLTEIGTLAGQLNIAKESVGEFTELVAMFAATTDVSIEQSATAFGRLSQLLGVPASELQNLGSSILAVGVNSVATESQIIAISTQITSMAATAGFSADEVFGLSAALASLGTQPELSRGVITRLFTNIQVAINDGGDRLQAFGRVAGVSGEQFAKAWGDDASGALLQLVEGLGALDQSQAVAVLDELGITAARDVPTILRLAQNSEVLAESLQVAAQGYAEGTALGDQYSVISSTVAEKLNILANNFQLLVSNVGAAAGGIGFLVDGLIALVKAMNFIVDNPVGATVAGIVVAFTALAGVVSLVSSLALRGVASFVALTTVTTQLGVASGGATATLRGLVTALTGVTASSSVASVAVKGLRLAFLSLPIIGVVLTGLAFAFDIFGEATKSAADKASDFFGDTAGFAEAIARDTEASKNGAKSYSTYTGSLESAQDAAEDAEKAIHPWINTQGDAATATDNTTDAIERQTIAFGANAKEWLRNALINTESLSKLATDPELQAALTAMGFNIETWLEASLSGEGAAEKYLDEIFQKALLVKESLPEGDIFANSIDESLNLLDEMTNGTNSLIAAQQELADKQEFLGISVDGTSDSFRDMNQEIMDSYNAISDAMSSTVDLENSIFSLGNSLAQAEGDWSIYSEAGRGNLEALMSVMDAMVANNAPEIAAAKLQGLFDFIIQGGYASASQLSILSQAISSLGGVKTAPIAFNPASFFGGWQQGADKAAKATERAGRSASRAANEVRTLADYARDLGGVFSRAFEIRFSAQSTLDKITMSFIEMREASAESARNIQKLKAEISGLQSDLNIQKYFLGIAIEYGDTKRAEAIQANIAKLQSEIADKTADLSEEQSKNSKTLTGNSKAAIENRSSMESLVKQYQSHIEALAASGMGQAELARRTQELRTQFIQQTTQMGYSRTEVEKYAKAFDDMATIIRKIPRNVTVDFNGDAALTAIREWKAKAQRELSGGGGLSIKPTFDDSSYRKAARAAELQAKLYELQVKAAAALERGNLKEIQNYSMQISSIKNQLSSGNYASGGYTGRGGKYEPAGIVHRGEYVIPKEHVNQSTGLPYADALGRLQKGAGGPGYANGGFVRPAPQSMSAAQIASLGPMAIQQFQIMLNEAMRLSLDGRVIADNSSKQFASSTASGAA